MSLLRSALVLAALCACARAECTNQGTTECGRPVVVNSSVPAGFQKVVVNLPQFAQHAGCHQTYGGARVQVCEPGAARPSVLIKEDLLEASVTLSTTYPYDLAFTVTIFCDCAK